MGATAIVNSNVNEMDSTVAAVAAAQRQLMQPSGPLSAVCVHRVTRRQPRILEKAARREFEEEGLVAVEWVKRVTRSVLLVVET